MYGYIYLTINKVNNKKYIGKHKSKEFDVKYSGSGILLTKAIKKYGLENFETVMIECCDSFEELNKKEKEYIESYNCVDSEEFYNLTKGGEGGDTRSWMSKLERSKVMSGKNNPMYGKFHSEESKQKISKSRTGIKLQPFTEDHKRKLSESNKGKNKGRNAWNKGLKMTKEQKKKLSESHMGKPGTRNGMKNSESHRRKISEGKKGKRYKTSVWKKCKIIFEDGSERIYETLKDCAKDNNISYSLAKTLVKSSIEYEDKHHKNPHIKGAKIIYV